MFEENMSQEFRLRNIEEIKNNFIKQIHQNEFMSKKNKYILTILNHIEHFFILASVVTGCTSISAFSSLAGIPVGITNSAIGLKICAIAAATEK